MTGAEYSAEESWRRFDDMTDRYNTTYPFFAELGQRLVDYAQATPGARLLDVGAGRGAVTQPALVRGCVVTAIDTAPRMVALLATELPQATVLRMDAGKLEFPDASFDVVTAGMVVDVLYDPAAVIGEIRRVLVPGGTFAFSVSGPVHDSWRWLVRLAAEFEQRPMPDTAAVDQQERIGSILAETGFVGLTRKLVEVIQPVSNPSSLWDQLMSEGLAEWVESLSVERAAEFRSQLLAGAEHMHANSGIIRRLTAIFYRAQRAL